MSKPRTAHTKPQPNTQVAIEQLTRREDYDDATAELNSEDDGENEDDEANELDDDDVEIETEPSDAIELAPAVANETVVTRTTRGTARGKRTATEDQHKLASKKKPKTSLIDANSKTIQRVVSAQDGDWVLQARVVARNRASTWTGVWGEGKMFELHLADKDSEIIKVAIFNKGVDAFDSVLKTGMTYLFSGGGE